MKPLFTSVRKKFLCDNPDEDGAICTSVEVTQPSSKLAHYMVGSTLRMQDCSRPIYISFDVYPDFYSESDEDHIKDEEEYDEKLKARLKKLDVLIDTLQKFKHDIVVAHTVRDELNRQRPAVVAKKDTQTED